MIGRMVFPFIITLKARRCENEDTEIIKGKSNMLVVPIYAGIWKRLISEGGCINKHPYFIGKEAWMWNSIFSQLLLLSL